MTVKGERILKVAAAVIFFVMVAVAIQPALAATGDKPDPGPVTAAD
jgi:hypothetical protein